MSACLLVLIGLPGSGKTTLARRLCSALSNSYRLVHIEYDAVVDLSEQARLQAAAAAGEGDDRWREARRELERAVEAVVVGGEMPETLRQAIGSSVDAADPKVPEATGDERPTVFIIDDNMYLRSMRYRYFQLARRHQLGFAAVLLDVPVSECLRRNAARLQSVPKAAIEAMATRLERPEAARLWETRSVTLAGGLSLEENPLMPGKEGVPLEAKREPGDSGRMGAPGDVATQEKVPERSECGVQAMKDPLELVAELIATALSSPVAPVIDNSLEAEASRLVCSTNQLHQLDRQLRRLVGQHAAGCGRRARAANLARQGLMRRVRAGEIGLDVEPEEERFEEVTRGLFEAELAAAGKE